MKTAWDIHLWRPNIDTGDEVIAINSDPERYAMVYDDTGPDLGVLKCDLSSYPLKNTHESLTWEDNVSLQKGEKVLVVGFPVAFHDISKNYRLPPSSTMASVMTVKDATVSSGGTKGNTLLSGLVGDGNNGSPVVSISQGKPKVIGTVWNGGQREGNSITDVVQLSVRKLIDKAKQVMPEKFL